jgi:outer membrane lipoprotein SlyB
MTTMTQDTYRTIGALTGLAAGVLLTVAVGYSGQIIPSALLGAGGCVAGAIIAERIHTRSGD